MALFIGNSLARGGILDLSEAQAAFSPWWDQLQDYVTYTIILIGLFAIPTANSEMSCSVYNTSFKSSSSVTPMGFIDSYCTVEVMSQFYSFLPYVIIIGPSALVFIEKFFTRTTAGGMKLRQFYTLLVRAVSKNDNLEQFQIENASSYKEFQSEFYNSKTFTISYIFKNVLEFTFAIAYNVWLWILSGKTFFKCNASQLVCERVHYQTCQHEDNLYNCVTPHVNFYSYIMISVLCLITLYILANFYTLLWISFTGLRPMSKLLDQYQRRLKESSPTAEKSHHQKHSLDVRYLLDLIAEKLGIDVALKIITVIDADFGPLWNVKVDKNLHLVSSSKIQITLSEPQIVNFLDDNYLKRFMYVLTLSDGESIMRQEAFLHDQCVLRRSSGFDRNQYYKANFGELPVGRRFSLQASTYFNGKEVIRHDLEEVATRPDPPSQAMGSWSAYPDDGQIYFNYRIQWESPAAGDAESDYTYIVEIFNDQNEIVEYETRESKCDHQVMNNWSLKSFRIWSIDGCQQKSQKALELEVSPPPSALNSYVTHLRYLMENDTHFQKDMNEYSFKLTLLGKTSQEVKALQDGLQLLYNSEHDNNMRVKI